MNEEEESLPDSDHDGECELDALIARCNDQKVIVSETKKQAKAIRNARSAKEKRKYQLRRFKQYQNACQTRVRTDGYVYVKVMRTDKTSKIIEDVTRHREQRAEWGFSWMDWINFDQFLAGVIANAVRDFRVDGIGYPAGMEVEEWHTILLSIETPMRDWATDKFGVGTHEERVKMYEDVKAAMHLFADHFGSFWD